MTTTIAPENAVAVPKTSTRWARPAALTARTLLGLCLLHAVWQSDLPQYQAKAMEYRLLVYPALATVVPLVWWLGSRRKTTPFPWVVDLCFLSPFLLDAAGNTANLYDTVAWWDDAMHVATWAPLVTAFGLAVSSRCRDRVELATAMAAFGMLAIIGWEVAEYLTFVSTHATESLSAYRDTIGDMIGSLLGTGLAIGAVLAVGRAQEVPQ